MILKTKLQNCAISTWCTEKKSFSTTMTTLPSVDIWSKVALANTSFFFVRQWHASRESKGDREWEWKTCLVVQDGIPVPMDSGGQRPRVDWQGVSPSCQCPNLSRHIFPDLWECRRKLLYMRCKSWKTITIRNFQSCPNLHFFINNVRRLKC